MTKIHKAINLALVKHLKGCKHPSKRRQETYSCNAVENALGELYPVNWAKDSKKKIDLALDIQEMEYDYFKAVVEYLGLEAWSQTEFNDIPLKRDRQKARAMWLTWVALMLEEGVV